METVGWIVLGVLIFGPLAIMLISFAVAGWDFLSTVGKVMRNPRKVYPKPKLEGQSWSGRYESEIGFGILLVGWIILLGLAAGGWL